MCILISEEANSQALNQQADQTHNESGKQGLPQREKQSHSEELPPFNWEGAGIKSVCSRIMCWKCLQIPMHCWLAQRSRALNLDFKRFNERVKARGEVQHLRRAWFCLLKDLNPLSPVCSDTNMYGKSERIRIKAVQARRGKTGDVGWC